MLRGTRWLVGALAAALWVANAAAQTSSSDQTGQSKTTQGGTATSPSAGPGKGGAGPDAQSAQTNAPRTATGEHGSSMGGMGAHAKGWAHTLAKLHAGNEMEVQAGSWMQDHATNDKVKDFAKKMVDDHGKMDKDLMSFAQSHQIDLASAPGAESTKDSAKNSATIESLKGMQGAQADRAYMKMMVQDHTKDVKETKAAAQHAKSAKNTELAKLLDKSAKTMEDHLKDAQKIQRDLTQRQARTPSSQ